MKNLSKFRTIRTFTNTCLVLLSVVITLVIAEFMVRGFLPQNRMVTWLETHPKGFMMNQAGGSSFQQFADRTANYSFTKQRLRGQEKDSTNKNRILAIGDSFTFGLLLNQEHTFTHQLNQNLKQAGNDSTVILNGGVGGAGLADWPLWLETYGKDVAPHIVLYYLNVSDLDRALSKNLFVLQNDSLIKSMRWQPQTFMFKLGKKGWYRWLQAKSDIANILVKLMWKHLYFKDVTHNFNAEESSYLIPDYDDFLLESDYSLNLGLKLISRIHNWCSANNCELIVTTTGFFEQKEQPDHTSKLYNSILESGLPSNIPFYDNTTCVNDLASNDLNNIRIPIDLHPNELGAEFIATCTWQWLPAVLKGQY